MVFEREWETTTSEDRKLELVSYRIVSISIFGQITRFRGNNLDTASVQCYISRFGFRLDYPRTNEAAQKGEGFHLGRTGKGTRLGLGRELMTPM